MLRIKHRCTAMCEIGVLSFELHSISLNPFLEALDSELGSKAEIPQNGVSRLAIAT